METQNIETTEDRQALVNIRTEWSYGAYVREKMQQSKPHHFWKRCDSYAGEMAARWANEWGATQQARDAAEGASLGETVRACSRLAEIGRCIILEEAARHCGWDADSTAPSIRSRIEIIG